MGDPVIQSFQPLALIPIAVLSHHKSTDNCEIRGLGPDKRCVCLFPDCEGSFKRIYDFRRHYQKHTQTEEWFCPVGGCRFSTRPSLNELSCTYFFYKRLVVICDNDGVQLCILHGLSRKDKLVKHIKEWHEVGHVNEIHTKLSTEESELFAQNKGRQFDPVRIRVQAFAIENKWSGYKEVDLAWIQTQTGLSLLSSSCYTKVEALDFRPWHGNFEEKKFVSNLEGPEWAYLARMRLGYGQWSAWKGYEAEEVASLGFIEWDEFVKNGRQIPQKTVNGLFNDSSNSSLNATSGQAAKGHQLDSAPYVEVNEQLPPMMEPWWDLAKQRSSMRPGLDDQPGPSQTSVDSDHQSTNFAGADTWIAPDASLCQSEQYSAGNPGTLWSFSTEQQILNDRSALGVQEVMPFRGHMAASMCPTPLSNAVSSWPASTGLNNPYQVLPEAPSDSANFADAALLPHDAPTQAPLAPTAAFGGFEQDSQFSSMATPLGHIGMTDFPVSSESAFDHYFTAADDLDFDFNEFVVPDENFEGFEL